MKILFGQRQRSLFFITCFVVVFAVSLRGEFVYDDIRVLQENPFIRNAANVLKLFSPDYFAGSQEMTFRPVVTASYFLDYALWGVRPFGFRLHNLLLHLAVCVLLWRVLWGITQSRAAAWWATFLFCFHPIQVEAVAVPSMREDLQCALFILLSWIFLWRGKGWWILGSVTYALALLSKETALFFPWVVGAAMVPVERNGGAVLMPVATHSRQRMLVLSSLGIVSVAYVWLRFFALRSPLEDSISYAGGTLWTNVLTHQVGWAWGIFCLAFPQNLTVDPWLPTQVAPWGIPALACGGVWLLIASCIVWAWRRQRTIAFGFLWFLGGLMPVAGILPMANVYADRYFYLPLVGLAIAFAAWLSQWKPAWYRRVIPVLMLWLGFLGFMTYQRLLTFQDNHTLWGDALIKMGKRPWPLGVFSTVDNAQREPLSVLQERTATEPHDPGPWTRLGAAHFVRGQYVPAARALEISLQKDQGNPDVHLMLGDVYCNLGHVDRARDEYETALSLRPNFSEAHNNLGVLYLKQGKGADAKEEFLTALSIKPDFADAISNLATVEANGKKYERAIALWQDALRIDPHHAPARWNLQRLKNTEPFRSSHRLKPG